MTTLTLPYPPSANRLWRNVNGKTLKSEQYRKWLALAAALVMSQRPKAVRGGYSLTVIATRPDNRRRDLDEKIVDVLLSSIRKKLGAETVGTVWGRGVVLTADGMARVGAVLGDGKGADAERGGQRP